MQAQTKTLKLSSLDKDSPVPLYYQLAELIRESILAGNLRPGDRLPGERELSEQAGISRMTARQALSYLVREGLVTVRPGVGTFVAEPKRTHPVLHLLGFTEEVLRQGGRAHSRVLEQRVIDAPPYVAAMLGMSDGEAVIKVTRLRYANDDPILLETTYVPQALCPGLEDYDLSNSSIYGLMESRYGLTIAGAHQTIEASVANEYELEQFGLARPIGVIVMEGVTYSEDGKAVEYSKAIYRGDRVKFELQSERARPASDKTTAVVSLLVE